MRRDPDSYEAGSVRAFHERHRFRETGGEDMVYRIALMAEELGEISACVTKGKADEALAEEVADLLIILGGLRRAIQQPRALDPVAPSAAYFGS